MTVLGLILLGCDVLTCCASDGCLRRTGWTLAARAMAAETIAGQHRAHTDPATGAFLRFAPGLATTSTGAEAVSGHIGIGSRYHRAGDPVLTMDTCCGDRPRRQDLGWHEYTCMVNLTLSGDTRVRYQWRVMGLPGSGDPTLDWPAAGEPTALRGCHFFYCEIPLMPLEHTGRFDAIDAHVCHGCRPNRHIKLTRESWWTIFLSSAPVLPRRPAPMTKSDSPLAKLARMKVDLKDLKHIVMSPAVQLGARLPPVGQLGGAAIFPMARLVCGSFPHCRLLPQLVALNAKRDAAVLNQVCEAIKEQAASLL